MNGTWLIEKRFQSVADLHIALRDPRTLGDVDFTIAHSNLPKKDQNYIINALGAHSAPKLIPISRTPPAFFHKTTHPWVHAAHPDEGLVSWYANGLKSKQNDKLTFKTFAYDQTQICSLILEMKYVLSYCEILLDEILHFGSIIFSSDLTINYLCLNNTLAKFR